MSLRESGRNRKKESVSPVWWSRKTALDDAIVEEEPQQIEGEIWEEEVEEVAAQLRIELPPQMPKNAIAIGNDYLGHRFTISFPSTIPDYFSEYHVSGSSDGIESVVYYQSGSNGYLEFAMDGIYVVDQTYQDECLYLNLFLPREAYDKIVVIDAGHGGSKPGAVQGDVMEKDIDLSIVQKIKEIFDEQEPDIGVFYTRLDDSAPTLEERVALANELRADLFISIHNNTSVKDKSLKGTQVLYRSTDSDALTSKRLARICLDEVVAALGSDSVGLLKGDKIHIIGNSKVPVALIEVGFMTNAKELALLNSDAYQMKAAEGVHQAIVRAFEEGY